MNRIYISGPITNNNNAKELFHNTQIKLEKEYLVTNPFEVFSDDDTFTSDKELYEYYLRMDIRALTFCDSIYMLKGFELSKGANIELNVAKAIGLKIIYE
jgi:hypothetical protein